MKRQQTLVEMLNAPAVAAAIRRAIDETARARVPLAGSVPGEGVEGAGLPPAFLSPLSSGAQPQEAEYECHEAVPA